MATEDRKNQPFDIVERAEHYNSHPSGIEVAEITDYLNFNLGNVFKYVARRYHKGTPQDYIRGIGSAHWYLRRFHDDPQQIAFAPDLMRWVVRDKLRRFADAETADTAKAFYNKFHDYLLTNYNSVYTECLDLLEKLQTEAPRVVSAEIEPLDIEKIHLDALKEALQSTAPKGPE